jgi:hypothetical protein
MYVKLQSMDTFGPNIQTNVEWLQEQNKTIVVCRVHNLGSHY